MVEKRLVHVDRALEDLIPGFLERRLAEVDSLREQLAGGDFKTIQRVGHTLKGTGGGYGFDALSSLGAALESAAIAADTAGIEAEIARMADYLARVRVIYD